ncbi:MAG: hydroxymethylglutaryl-CoA lyase [Pseudomonadota bacterium]
MNTQTNIELVEVSPRDGLQSEPQVLPTEQKAALISRAVDAGVRRLEVTSFVHPKRVPQMADAEALMALLPREPGVSYIGLILNQRGFDRAVAARVHEVNMPVVASDTYNQRNQGVPTAQSIEDWSTIAEQAHASGIRPGVTISAAFGCPFEGIVEQDRVIEIAEQVAAANPFEISLADSIGVAGPAEVTTLIQRMRALLPDTPIRCHFHNTRNTGLANAFAAVQAGANALDASIGGIGGCPFAPAATGNIPTDDLLYMLHRAGIATGVDLDRIIAISGWLQDILKHDIPAMLPKAGNFPGTLSAAISACD